MFSSCRDFRFPLRSATHKYQQQNFSPQLPCITSSWPATLFGTKIIWVEGKWTLSGNICVLSRSMVSVGLFECFRKEFKVVWYGLKEVMSYFLILASKCRKQKVTCLGLTLMEFTLLKKWCENAWQMFFFEEVIFTSCSVYSTSTSTVPSPKYASVFNVSLIYLFFFLLLFSLFFFLACKKSSLISMFLFVHVFALRCGRTWQLCVKKLMRQS